MSVGVCWTSIGLSTAVQSFLVVFDCWFGDILADSLARKFIGLTNPMSMHQKVTGKSQSLDNSSHSRAKNLAFWIGRVQQSLTKVWPEKGGECKDLFSTYAGTRLLAHIVLASSTKFTLPAKNN